MVHMHRVSVYSSTIRINFIQLGHYGNVNNLFSHNKRSSLFDRIKPHGIRCSLDGTLFETITLNPASQNGRLADRGSVSA